MWWLHGSINKLHLKANFETYSPPNPTLQHWSTSTVRILFTVCTAAVNSLVVTHDSRRVGGRHSLTPGGVRLVYTDVFCFLVFFLAVHQLVFFTMPTGYEG